MARRCRSRPPLLDGLVADAISGVVTDSALLRIWSSLSCLRLVAGPGSGGWPGLAFAMASKKGSASDGPCLRRGDAAVPGGWTAVPAVQLPK